MKDTTPTTSQENERKDNASVTIAVVTSINREQLKCSSPLSSKCCIYRVPEKLREANTKAYTPRIVSIGPFHHGEKHLEAMEKNKLWYMQAFLNRIPLRLEDYVKDVETWEEEARLCYAETIGLKKDEFVKMLAVDGSFIVELLLRQRFPQLQDNRDPIFKKQGMFPDVCRDMMLLENQLPFFVLDRVFNLVPVSMLHGNRSFLELCYKCFGWLLKIDRERLDLTSDTRRNHFVDFMRCCLVRRLQSQDTGNYVCPPSVTKLHESGVKFQKGTSGSLLEINFNNGILEIPHLQIEDGTESLFRNLIAFEQSHCIDKIFTDYMGLLDGMINTYKDVDLLMHHGIITNMLGSSEEVATLFNNMCKEVFCSSEFNFSGLCTNLNDYCGRPWHKWKATLKRDYFNTPWKGASVIAATVLLILTFIQTACSIIQLFVGTS